MKPSQTPVSDELLNAMLDGELDSAEYESLHERIGRDPELNRRARELVKLKRLVRLARPEDPIEEKPSVGARRRFSWGTRAAVAMLALAGVVALALQGRLDESTPPATMTLAALQAQFDRTPASGIHEVIVHVRRGDEASLQALLDELDRLLEHVRRTGGELQVEVLADGPGLALLRADISPMIERIREMKARNKNLVFVACNRTRTRLEQEGGHPVPLMPEAEIVPSVQEQIVQRKRQGWHYIAA